MNFRVLNEDLKPGMVVISGDPSRLRKEKLQNRVETLGCKGIHWKHVGGGVGCYIRGIYAEVQEVSAGKR